VFIERTSVGLDVHARSVVACAIDTVTGELIRSRLTAEHPDVLGWIGRLPGPVAVAYEAGPTGFGLARALGAAGVRCEVLAPSKPQRPAAQRSRPMRVTHFTWPGCCAWTSSPVCGCPARPRRPPGTWCARVRTCAGI
jgi:hypothetical protein